MTSSQAEAKGLAQRQLVQRKLAFLDERVPKLMAEGYKGRTARHQADREWANILKAERQANATD